MSVCVSVCLCVCLSVCRSVCLSVCLSVFRPTPIRDKLPSLYFETQIGILSSWFFDMSVCLYACVCLSVCLSFCRSVCLSVTRSMETNFLFFILQHKYGLWHHKISHYVCLSVSCSLPILWHDQRINGKQYLSVPPVFKCLNNCPWWSCSLKSHFNETYDKQKSASLFLTCTCLQ